MKNVMKIVAAVLVVCAMTVCACATAFVPSVEQKEVPTVVEVPKTVVLPENVIVAAPQKLIVNPLATAIKTVEEAAEKGEEAIEEVAQSEAMVAAYEALMELGSAEAIDESLAGAVVTDVFEVTCVDDELQAALDAGEPVAVAMEYEVEEGQTITVLFFDDPDWVVVPAEKVAYEDGVLVITMEKMGVYAVVVG